MAVEPGHPHLPAIKILHLDKFLAPRQFVPLTLTAFGQGLRRDTAPVTIYWFSTPGQFFSHLENLYPWRCFACQGLWRDTLTLVLLGQGLKHVMLNKTCTWPSFAAGSLEGIKMIKLLSELFVYFIQTNLYKTLYSSNRYFNAWKKI